MRNWMVSLISISMVALGFYDVLYLSGSLSVMNFILILAGSAPWLASAFEYLELTKDGMKTKRMNELERHQDKISKEFENLKKNIPNYREIETQFECLETHVTLRYHTTKKMEYVKTKKVRALTDNLGGYADKYLWTGDKEMQIRCRNPKHSFIDKGRLNVWNFYEVKFQKKLNKNDIEEFSVIWNLTDHKGDFHPFIAAVIEEPTEKLILSLDASSIRDKINSASYEITSHLGSNTPFETGDLESETGIYTYMAHDPALLHNYELRWTLH